MVRKNLTVESRSCKNALYLVLILNLQHGPGAAEVLHHRLGLFKQLIAVYRPLKGIAKTKRPFRCLNTIFGIPLEAEMKRLDAVPSFYPAVVLLCCPESLTG